MIGTETLVLALTTLIGAVVAFLQNQKKKDAEEVTQQVIGFYDPGNTEIEHPYEVDVELPKRSYLMSESTKHWLIQGHTPVDQAYLLKQVEDAENYQRTEYTIGFNESGGGYYQIEFGLITGSGRGAKEMKTDG